MSSRSLGTGLAVALPLAIGAASATATPIFHGISLGNSFTHKLELPNGHGSGEQLGSFTKIVVELVSQRSGDHETQHVFERVDISNFVAPDNSWHPTTVPDNQPTVHGEGHGDETVKCDVTFHGSEHDEVDYKIKYYEDDHYKGGYELEGHGDGRDLRCGELDSPVPLPGEAAMAGFGLVGLVGGRALRRRRA